MLTLEQISRYFTPGLRDRNPRGMLVEYLQYELLDSLFKDPAGSALSFIGGTAIRILHDSYRFSEDLDFDNFDLPYSRFEKMLNNACRDLEYKGFIIEYRILTKGAYHCYIRFPEMLQRSGLTPHSGEKILIRVDSEAKKKTYEPQTFILNKYAVYRRILAAPVKILLAQKMMTILYRKREKGRDLYDVSFLMGLGEPDFQYIEKTLGLNRSDFLRQLNTRIGELDLHHLAQDVGPFLFTTDQRERITTFKEFWNSIYGNS